MERVGWKPGVILDDLPMTNEEAICLLSQILETLAICGILETPEHRGFLDSFTPLKLRDTGDLRKSLSYPLNWWRRKNGVNFDHVKRVFNLDML